MADHRRRASLHLVPSYSGNRGRTRAYPAPVGEKPLRRFLPRAGELLTLDHIRGEWWPSGSVAGACVFAVRWDAGRFRFWAALSDFGDADALALIDQCRQADRDVRSECWR